MNIDGIIFDLDGTLWNSVKVVTKAWNHVLKEFKEARGNVTEEMLQSIMGLQIPQIGQKFFPYLDKELQIKIVTTCCEDQLGFIEKEGGILFPELEETLSKLSEKYPLFIVSNCNFGYIEAFYKYHKLDKYFKDYEHAGNTGLSKGENIKIIMKRNNLKNAVYVGDTQGDCDATRKAGIPFIYASYGFGRVSDYDYVIERPSDLMKILQLK